MTLASLSWMPRGVMKKSVQKILVLGCSPRPCESGPLAWVFLSLSQTVSPLEPRGEPPTHGTLGKRTNTPAKGSFVSRHSLSWVL